MVAKIKFKKSSSFTFSLLKSLLLNWYCGYTFSGDFSARLPLTSMLHTPPTHAHTHVRAHTHHCTRTSTPTVSRVRGNCWGEGDSRVLGESGTLPPVAWKHASFPQEVGLLILISELGNLSESNPGLSDSRTQALYEPTGEQGTKQTHKAEEGWRD